MPRRGPIASCYECAGIRACYGTKQPGIPRDEGRRVAAACAKPEKGRTTDVVRVAGRDRGMSRKNAQEAVEAGEAVWEAAGVVRFLVERPLGGAALKVAKAAAKAAGWPPPAASGSRDAFRAASGPRPPVPPGRAYRPGGVWWAEDAPARRDGREGS